MFLNGKDKRIKILITAVILLCLLTACGLGGKKNSGNTPSAQGTQQSQQTQQTQETQKTQQKASGQDSGSQASGSVFPEDSILNFQNDKGFARLQSDMKNGDIPLECNVLYDQGGSRPDVTVTDQESIREIYNQLADITVGDKSSQSVTDSYHHVTFRLRNDTYVSFYFEGENLFCWGKDNYAVSGGNNLWNTVRKLQIAAMNSTEKQGQTAGQAEQAAASKTSSSSAKNSDSGSTKKNEVKGEAPEGSQDDVEAATGVSGSPLGGKTGKDSGTVYVGGSPAEVSPQEPSAQNEISGSNRKEGESGRKPASDVSGNAPEQDAANPSGTGLAGEAGGGLAGEPGGGPAEEAAGGTVAKADPAETVQEDPKKDSSNPGTAGQEDPGADPSDSTTAATAEAAKETADPTLNPAIEAAYTDIVRAYARVLTIDKDTFMEAYSQGLYSKEAPNPELAPDFDERINYDLFLDLYTGALEGSAVYGLHDYNKDGIQELVIALADGEYKTLRAMYTYDGKKAVSLFTGSLTPAYRVDVFSLPNQEFIVHSSGGAASGGDTICRIADDVSGLQIIADYEYDAVKYGNLDHISKTGEVMTEADFYAKYSETSNPVDGLSLKQVSQDASVSLLPAE